MNKAPCLAVISYENPVEPWEPLGGNLEFTCRLSYVCVVALGLEKDQLGLATANEPIDFVVCVTGEPHIERLVEVR